MSTDHLPAAPRGAELPDALSARRTFSTRHVLLLGASGVLLAAAGLHSWKGTATAVLTAGTLTFCAVIAFKAQLVWHAWRCGVTPRQDPPLADRDLPSATVLVPLYHEANVVGDLVRHLQSLDYPQDRLQVLLLVEDEDAGTRAALAALAATDLPPVCTVLVVPDGHPRTKPRACNVGLAVATGDLLVIYDAEDRPEPDQLRVAAAGFAAAEPSVACLQARLDYHNHARGRLARFFANEYNHWFDLLLPALAERGLPIPLGGTSNHFRTAVLRELGGWDAWNVTEDADVGIRLWAAGYQTAVIDSVTWEEACSQLRPWLRQRTRWVKGYLQTFLVHTRDLGWLRRRGRTVPAAVAFTALIAGTPLVNLLNPIFWTLFLVHIVTRWTLIVELLPPPWLYLAVGSFVLGNLGLVALNLTAAAHRRRWHLATSAVLAPAYWLLMAAASWRALWQLVRSPHVWEKTPHGLSDGPYAIGGAQHVRA